MKTEKYFFIGVLIFLIVVYIFAYAIAYIGVKSNIEAMKAGLEQCPQEPNTYYIDNRTIWVKSCAEYIKTYKGNK